MENKEYPSTINITSLLPICRKLPRSVCNLLELWLGLRELNRALISIGKKNTSDFVKASLEYLQVETRIFGIEHLDKIDRPLLVANHPLGCIDGLILLDILLKRYNNVILIANDLLMKIEALHPILVPLRLTRNAKDPLKTFQKIFESDAALLHFPAGLCSRKQGDKIQDPPWDSSYVKLANNREIIPCFVSGENSRFFYWISKLRTRIKLRVNIEMYLLISEMFKKRYASIDCFIGSPIDYKSRLASGQGIKQINKFIRSEVYGLPEIFKQSDIEIRIRRAMYESYSTRNK